MIAPAMPAAMRAYSMAVAADSFSRKRAISFRMGYSVSTYSPLRQVSRICLNGVKALLKQIALKFVSTELVIRVAVFAFCWSAYALKGKL